jgi:two-component system NarL family sensor kinase
MKTRDLAILNAIAEALNSAPDVQQALERTLALVAELLGLRTGWIWLVDPETGQFYNAAVQNLPPYLQEPVRMTGRRCWCLDAFAEGELTPKNVDVMTCSRLLPAVEAAETTLTEGLRYHASIPLSFQGVPLGIMNVTGPSWRKLTRDELRLLSTIGYQVGIAVERARLAEEGTRRARAEERTRLAREIHDTLAQDLTAIGLHLEGALTQLDRDPARARERIERALATARRGLEEARQSVLDLRAAPLAGRSLPDALAALGRSFTSETGVRVHVRCRLSPSRRLGKAPSHAPAGTQTELPRRVEAELYAIAQEALTNVRKHARARAVDLNLSRQDDTLRLVIQDDGAGFDPRATAGRAAGYGLQGMRERARMLGGTLRVRSHPGQGTRVTVTVPVAPAATG